MPLFAQCHIFEAVVVVRIPQWSFLFVLLLSAMCFFLYRAKLCPRDVQPVFSIVSAMCT